MIRPWPEWTRDEPIKNLERAHRGGEPPGLSALLAKTGAPLEELCCTVYSARVGAMAAARGHAFVHHEARIWTPLPEALAPEAHSADRGSILGPSWVQNVLEVPKYFGAFLDAPLATYDPNHRHKWRAHELLHRLVGFYWAPDMTRLEAYLGARLSELLPLVHWYGWDEMARARCVDHRDGRLLHRTYCQPCEDIRSCYWARPADTLDLRRDEMWFGKGLSHLQEELQIIEQEMASGRPIASPRPGLDASSDARAYLDGHWARTSAWSFGAWVELFCEVSRDYESSVAHMFNRVGSTADELLHGDLVVDPRDAAAQRSRQLVRDLGYRSLCALEWSEDGQVEDTVWPAIVQLAEASRALGAGQDVSELDVMRDELLARFAGVSAALPAGVVDGLGAQGDVASLRAPASVTRSASAAQRAALAQVRDGLVSAFADSFSPQRCPEARIEEFVRSENFWGPGALDARYLRYLEQVGAAIDPALTLESWLRARPHGDDLLSNFGGVPDEVVEPSGLRLNQSLRRGVFTAQAIEDVLGWRPEQASRELAAIWLRGEVRVIEVDAAMAGVFDWVRAGADSASDPGTADLTQIDREALLGLIEASFVAYLPPAR